MPRRPDSPAQLPLALRGKPHIARVALELGVSASRLRASDLEHMFHGVIVPRGWGRDVTSLARAYAMKMSCDQCFSHATAAILWDMRLPRDMRERSELHVTTRPPQRAPRGHFIRGHVGTPQTATVDDLCVTTAVATWCQLASMLSVDDLIIAADGLLSRKLPRATMAELQTAVESWRGYRGFHQLQDAMVFVRERTDSARETMLRLLILRAGMAEPMINVPIRSRAGAIVAHADLAYPEFNLVLEYDGDQHRTDRAQYYLDINRLERITREGWRVIRINLKHMANPMALAALIREALADGARQGK
jgi:very-short-patch-repair endonuclease